MLPPYLTEADLDALIARALEEDVGPGDVTSEAILAPEVEAEGYFLAKESGVLAGLAVAARAFAAVDAYAVVRWTRDDGDPVTAGTIFGSVRGPARSLLQAERLALNLLQRMSGIATHTRRMVAAVHPHDPKILDTRKTAPGLRLLDKWAVRLGGGTNHRIGLFDQILIKDNHITAAGGVHQALAAAQQYRVLHNGGLPIEIEADSLKRVQAALDYFEANGGVDFILLDNLVHLRPDGSADVSKLREAVAMIGGRIATEASGNVTLGTAAAIASTGVDAISCGALTHSVTALDISLTFDLNH